MMKWLLFVCALTASTVNAMDLEYLRKSYSKAASDKVLCKSVMEKLSNEIESDVHKAYLGGLMTIWANHVSGAIAKLNSFNLGKEIIEKAVKSNPDNVEIRFIRFSVQKNCPSFLGYNKNMAADKKFLKENQHAITSEQLKKMVKSLIEG